MRSALALPKRFSSHARYAQFSLIVASSTLRGNPAETLLRGGGVQVILSRVPPFQNPMFWDNGTGRVSLSRFQGRNDPLLLVSYHASRGYQ